MKKFIILIVAGIILFVGAESIVGMTDRTYSPLKEVHTWMLLLLSWVIVFKPLVPYWWNRVDEWYNQLIKWIRE